MPDDAIAAGTKPVFLPEAERFLAARGGSLSASDIPGLLRCYGLRPDGIADLSALGLSPEAIEARRGYLGGSDIRTLVEDDQAKVMQLWRVKTGREQAEDLSDLFHVHLGNVTEGYNLAWLEKRFKIGITRHGERVYHSRYDWAAVTLDGFLEHYHRGTRVVQCKHVNGFSKIDDVVARYSPQGQYEAGVSGADGAILAVIIGTNEPVWQDLEFDPVYFGQLLDIAGAFMALVKSDTPPYDLPRATVAPAKAAKAIRLGEKDMTGNNAWADAAGKWLSSQAAAKEFEGAAKTLKELVGKDLARAWGHGIEIVSNKAGSLSIKPFTDPNAPATPKE
jgi:predicted phage-related endonuclease